MAVTEQSLYNTIFGVHRNGRHYKQIMLLGEILQRNYRKMTMGHFPIIPL